MSGWESFIRSLLSSYEVAPGVGSVWHIVGIVITLACCVGVVFLNRILNKKSYKYILLGVWIVLLILEVFKQITFSYYLENGALYQRYNWTFFPFQFCDVIFYLLPFIVFLKDNAARKRIELFSSLFFLLGGIVGMVGPGFSTIIWINAHTLIHHGSMMVVAILIALRNKDQFVFYKFLQADIIFGCLLVIAIALNGIVPAAYPPSIERDVFNMFFISWHKAPEIPIVKDIWNSVPYAVYLLIYILGVLLITFAFYVIYSAILNHRVDFSINEKQHNEAIKKHELALKNKAKKKIKKNVKTNKK